MAFVWWPDKKKLSEAGFASIAHIPVLFGADWNYLREANRYLRERALLEWKPGNEEPGVSRFRPKYPTRQTLENIARQLCNFFEWAEHQSIDWKSIEYTNNIVNGYQADMLSGRWSKDGSALNGRTVNNRVGEACSFLKWAAARHLRGHFVVVSGVVGKIVDSGTSSTGHAPRGVEVRAGAVRINPALLRLPSPSKVARWLEEVRILRGETKSLMCELVLETGVRRQEVVLWQANTLPLNRSDWHRIGDNVQVTISFGAKGPKRHPNSLEGPARRISLPLRMAEKLDEYRRLRRAMLLGKWVKSAQCKADFLARRRTPEPAQLFISDFTGRPFSDQAFYDGWKNIPALPYKEWSPHLGRHYWACMTLLKSQSDRVMAIERRIDEMSDNWITAQAMTDIELIIRPQLGHISSETTNLYLQWLHGAITLVKYAHNYHEMLERLDG